MLILPRFVSFARQFSGSDYLKVLVYLPQYFCPVLLAFCGRLRLLVLLIPFLVVFSRLLPLIFYLFLINWPADEPIPLLLISFWLRPWLFSCVIFRLLPDLNQQISHHKDYRLWKLSQSAVRGQ